MTNPAALEWLRNAYKAVGAAFPMINCNRADEEERVARENFDFYFGCYFYPKMEPPSVTLDQLREAWRKLYRMYL